MSETDLLQGLITSGPLAGVLAIAVVKLWAELRAERQRTENLHREIREILRAVARAGEHD